MNWPSARVIREKLFEALRYGALGLCVYLVAMHFVRGSSGPKAGATAAQFDLPLAGAEGRVSLASLRGTPVLMEVFASWCGACKSSAPRLAEAYEKHKGKNVRFLAVSVDEDPRVAARIKDEWQLPFDVAHDDGSVSRGYQVSMLPTLVYIDEHGTVRHASAGVASRSEIDDWLSEAQ